MINKQKLYNSQSFLKKFKAKIQNKINTKKYNYKPINKNVYNKRCN